MELLIVDDDTICTFINTRIAHTSGLFSRIRAVDNGKDALALFERVAEGAERAPDVVLLDLNMPLMNGFDFIKNLRRITFPGCEKIGIVVLTSSDNPLDLAQARELGIEHYLVKSLTAKDLHTTVFSLAERRAAD